MKYPLKRTCFSFSVELYLFTLKVEMIMCREKAYSAFVSRVNSDGNEDAQLIKEVITLSKVGKRKR